MSKSIKLFLLFTLIAMSLSSGFAQNEVEGIAQRKSIPPPYLSIEDNWIDQHMSEMSLREKIGQLFMVAAYSNKGKRHTEQLKKQIEDYNIGGLIFFQGAPHAQAKFTNQLQSISNIPLLIAQDAEWGLSMRLDSVIGLPKQLALGAVRNNELIFDYGRIVDLSANSVCLDVDGVVSTNTTSSSGCTKVTLGSTLSIDPGVTYTLTAFTTVPTVFADYQDVSDPQDGLTDYGHILDTTGLVCPFGQLDSLKGTLVEKYSRETSLFTESTVIKISGSGFIVVPPQWNNISPPILVRNAAHAQADPNPNPNPNTNPKTLR